jgi:hypothetical protein
VAERFNAPVLKTGMSKKKSYSHSIVAGGLLEIS